MTGVPGGVGGGEDSDGADGCQRFNGQRTFSRSAGVSPAWGTELSAVGDVHPSEFRGTRTKIGFVIRNSRVAG